MDQITIKDQVLEKIVGVVVLFVALGAIVGAGYFYSKSKSTRNWPVAEGIIIKSSTRIQREPGGKGAPTTIADVWYTFNVDGIEYQNDTISLSQYGSSSASHAVKEAHRYPVGSRVSVYYNPEHPHDAVLEHKTPWVYISIFAGLGAILFFISITMLSGRSKSSLSTSATRYGQYSHARGRKTTTVAGFRLIAAILLSSILFVILGYHLFFTENAANRGESGQATDYLPDKNGPQSVSTYSKNEILPPCEVFLKAQVAQSQKINLDDGIHSLYVTATLCIDEQEMKTATQAHRTWPIIARHLAAYDKAVFDPGSMSLNAGENESEDFSFRLKRIEQECLEYLHENSIFFVKAIRFESFKVFRAD
jgi:hypothetical protein